MAYRLYAQEWHLSHTVTAGIFAIYPIVVVAVLIGFGDISDHIGRRAAMLMGLGASLAGTLLFAIAPSMWSGCSLARALMGVGVGLTAGPSTAAVVEFATGGPSKRAALITTVAQAGGFAAALLLGGALVQYAPWPTRLSFWVLAALLALLFAAAWFLPRQRLPTAGRWRPRAPSIPRDVRASVHARSLRDDDGLHAWRARAVAGRPGRPRSCGYANAFVGGAVLSLFAIVSGADQASSDGRCRPARDDPRRACLGHRHGAAGPGGRAARLPIFLSGDIDRRRRIQPAVSERVSR